MNILNFLVKPGKTTEELLTKESSSKIKIIIVLLIIFSLSSVLYIAFSMMGAMFTTTHYVISFFYNIIGQLVAVLAIWLIGKIFTGKASYLDALLVTICAELPFMFAYIILIILGFLSPLLAITAGTIILIAALIWCLVIWSKGLSKAEQFSETKVTFTVILSIIVLYFGNSFVSGLTRLSLF